MQQQILKPFTGQPWAILKAPDRTIMEWALANAHIVFTNDLDFGTLLAATQANSPSVIQVRTQDVLPTAIAELVISALCQFQTQLETGALITIISLVLKSVFYLSSEASEVS